MINESPVTRPPDWFNYIQNMGAIYRMTVKDTGEVFLEGTDELSLTVPWEEIAPFMVISETDEERQRKGIVSLCEDAQDWLRRWREQEQKEREWKDRRERNVPAAPGDYILKRPDGSEIIRHVYVDMCVSDGRVVRPVDDLDGVWSDRLPTWAEMRNRQKVLEMDPEKIGYWATGSDTLTSYKSIGILIKRLIDGETVPE